MKKKKRKILKRVNLIDLILPAFIIILGLFLRLYNLGHNGLWMDEIWSVTRSQVPISTILAQKFSYGDASYGYYPVHYLIIHAALIFGKSEFILRLPSVIFGVASIPLSYLIGKMLFGKKIGLLASFFLTISAFHIHYSQEARYYSYFTFFSLLTLYSFLKAIFAEEKKRWIALFIVSTILNFILHFVAMIVFLSEIISLPLFFPQKTKFFQKWFKKNILWASIVGVAGILSFLLAAPFIKTMQFNKPEIIFSNLRSLLNQFSGYSITNYNVPTLSWLNVPSLFFLSIFLYGIFSTFRNKKYSKQVFFLVIWTVFPLIFLLTVAPKSFGFHPRHVIFLLPTAFMLIALGINNLEYRLGTLIFRKAQEGNIRVARVLILSIIIFCYLIIGIPLIKADYNNPKEAWRELSAYLTSNTNDGDVVFADSPDNTLTALKFYFGDEKRNVRLITVTESLPNNPGETLFRRYYVYHDWVDADHPPTSIEIADEQIDKIIPFGDMYVYQSKPIAFWQESEDKATLDDGWDLSEGLKRRYLSTNAALKPEATTSFKITVPNDGKYDLYASLFWNGIRGTLKYRIDGKEWSNGFQPAWGEVGNVFNARWKEVKLGTGDFKAGDHVVTFLNTTAGDGGGSQTIDYFYLTPSESNGKK